MIRQPAYQPVLSIQQARLTFLAQGSQDTSVSNEFQDVTVGASVVAVWRVVCQVPTEKGTITEALAYVKQCDPKVPDAEENTESPLKVSLTICNGSFCLRRF